MGAKAVSPGVGFIILEGKHAEDLFRESDRISSDDFEGQWAKRECFLFCENLKTVIASFGDQFEPWSRCVFDDFGKAVVRIVASQEGSTTLVFEVRVGTRKGSSESSSRKKTGPEGSQSEGLDLVVFGTTGTCLIGRLDYLAMLSSALKRAHLLRLKKVKAIEEIKEAIEDLDADGEEFLLCIIETKRLLEKMEELEKHSPQVIAQSIAVLQKTRRTSVPWCLTDGQKWVFGLTWRATNQREGYHYDTATVSWLTEHPVGPDCPEDLNSRSKQILKILVGWATTNAEKIQELMMVWRKAQGRKT
ncbi:hypothetical protein H1R20_g11189, partial [Candolleomyces eurysporus]